MSKIVSPKLLMDGSEFLPKSSYRVFISQTMGDHSTFRISFPTNATEGYGGALMDNALRSAGKKISIGLDDGALEFVGLITSVNLQKRNGAPGTLTLSGYSPSILLSKSAQCLSYEEGTALGQVLADTFGGHATDLLKTSIGSGTNIKLPYTVQYNEDDFSFIRRLCARYGVWMYDNGKEFHIGGNGQGQRQGTYGENIRTFQLSADLQERSFGIRSHDWMNDSPLEADSSAHSPQSGHPYTSTVNKESEALFSKKGNYHWPIDQHEFSGQQGVDIAVKVATMGKTAAMVTASGTSELVSLCVGDILAVEGLNFTDPDQKDAYGSYMVTKVIHRFDHSGQYLNEFEGVPDGTQHPAYGNIFKVPFAQSQRGLVLENADPEGMGRIKVQFPWQRPMGTTTPWIKMHTPYSGADKGFYMIPEIDEEVLVGFEGGNPERPFVLSAGYNAGASSGMADADNNIKAIKTRSGHLIELDDTEDAEIITIKDKNENLFSIDTKTNDITINANNNVTVNAEAHMILKSKNMDIQVAENLNIAVGGNKMESTAKNSTTTTSENHTIKAANIFELASESIRSEADEIKRQAEQDITMNSKNGNINKKADKKIINNSGEVGNLF